MGSTPGLFLENLSRIVSLRVDQEIRSQLLCMGEFAIVYVDCANQETHCLRILDSQVSQPANTGDGNPFSGFRLRLLDSFISRNACTDKWRSLDRFQTRWNVRDIIWVCKDVFGKATVLRIAPKLRVGADCLPRRKAILTVPTCGVEPWNADTVALLHGRHTTTDCDNGPDGLMARNKRRLRFDRPISVCSVKVGVANTAGLRFDKYLSDAGCRHFNIPQNKRLSKLLDHCCLHLFGHKLLLLCNCRDRDIPRGLKHPVKSLGFLLQASCIFLHTPRFPGNLPRRTPVVVGAICGHWQQQVRRHEGTHHGGVLYHGGH